MYFSKRQKAHRIAALALKCGLYHMTFLLLVFRLRLSCGSKCSLIVAALLQGFFVW